MAQMNSSRNNDRVSNVLDEMVELDIDIEIEEIKNMSKGKFKPLLNERVTRKAFIYLIERKSSRHSDRANGFF